MYNLYPVFYYVSFFFVFGIGYVQPNYEYSIYLGYIKSSRYMSFKIVKYNFCFIVNIIIIILSTTYAM